MFFIEKGVTSQRVDKFRRIRIMEVTVMTEAQMTRVDRQKTGKSGRKGILPKDVSQLPDEETPWSDGEYPADCHDIRGALSWPIKPWVLWGHDACHDLFLLGGFSE